MDDLQDEQQLKTVQQSSTTSINNHYFLLLPLFLGVALFLIGLVIGYLFGSKMYTFSNKSQVRAPTTTVIPTMTIIPTIEPTIKKLIPPETQDEIVWKTYNFTTDKDKNIAFSFKYPDVGDECNGCFDSLGVSTNNFGIWITGSYFENTNKNWDLQVSVYLPSANRIGDQPFIDNLGAMFNKDKSLNIGKSYEETKEYNNISRTVKVTRLEDVIIMGKISRQYSINLIKGNGFTISKNEITKKAFVEFPNYTIGINYTYNIPLYNVFDKILTSFSQDLYPKPDHEGKY